MTVNILLLRARNSNIDSTTIKFGSVKSITKTKQIEDATDLALDRTCAKSEILIYHVDCDLGHLYMQLYISYLIRMSV